MHFNLFQVDVYVMARGLNSPTPSSIGNAYDPTLLLNGRAGFLNGFVCWPVVRCTLHTTTFLLASGGMVTLYPFIKSCGLFHLTKVQITICPVVNICYAGLKLWFKHYTKPRFNNCIYDLWFKFARGSKFIAHGLIW
jgi:hypothetical protein